MNLALYGGNLVLTVQWLWLVIAIVGFVVLRMVLGGHRR